MPGFQELMVITVVALIVLGPERLPKLASSATRLLTRIREERDAALASVRSAGGVDGLSDELRVLRQELDETRELVQETFRHAGRSPSGPSSERRAVSGHRAVRTTRSTGGAEERTTCSPEDGSGVSGSERAYPYAGTAAPALPEDGPRR